MTTSGKGPQLVGRSPTPELRGVYAACALIEQFEACLTHLERVTVLVPSEAVQVELRAIQERLRAAIQALDTDVSVLPVVTEGLTQFKYSSSIERLGLGGEIVRLKRDLRLTTKQIAERTGLSTHQISTFLRQYEQATPLQRAAIQRRSIFDTTDRMEELAAIIYRQLARLEGNNDDLAVRYTSELRSTIELAAKLTKEIANYQKFHQLVQTVTEILLDELPSERQRILQRISRVVGNLGLNHTRMLDESTVAGPPVTSRHDYDTWGVDAEDDILI